MKVRSKVLQFLHLDSTYSLLSARCISIALEFFKAFDIHKNQGLNDIQFCQLMFTLTDMNRKEIYRVFDMLDTDASGQIEFDEFYLLICILLANQDSEVKQFIFRHSRIVFDLLDEDGSNSVSADEFELFGFLFNFHGDAVRRIFNEFDISGDQELDYKEFRMFAMACIDKENELREQKKQQKLQPRKDLYSRTWTYCRRCLGLDKAEEQDVTFFKADQHAAQAVPQSKKDGMALKYLHSHKQQ